MPTKQDDDWREFEKLVAQIEAQAGPRGATVEWNDQIPDLDTGQPRQIDVSIRQRLGTTDILMIIECRKRKQLADVRWIESLASKQKSVGAAKVIAVSERGFSKPAQTKAWQLGIELRGSQCEYAMLYKYMIFTRGEVAKRGYLSLDLYWCLTSRLVMRGERAYQCRS